MRDDQVSLRLLRGEALEMAKLQQVLEAAPTYSQRVTGSPAGPADAQSTYTMLPEGKSYDDKFVYGVCVDGAMVGCVDLIRGYPDSHTAHIGLLLISEAHQRRGIGRAAYCRVESDILAWNTCRRVRIGVVRSNDAVLPFWEGLGFVQTGEVKPYRYGTVESEVMILNKPLKPAR